MNNYTDTTLLLYIYQNAKVGSSSLRNIIDKIKDKQLIKLLQLQINNYNKIIKSATFELSKIGQDEQDTIQIPKITTYTGTKLDNLDNSTEVVSTLLTTTSLGNNDLEKVLDNSYSNKNVLNLGKKLQNCESNFIYNLQNYT